MCMMPVEELDISNNPITDYTPLLAMPNLEKLQVGPDLKNLEPLRRHPTLKFIGYDRAPYRPVAEFWKDYDAKQAVGKK